MPAQARHRMSASHYTLSIAHCKRYVVILCSFFSLKKYSQPQRVRTPWGCARHLPLYFCSLTCCVTVTVDDPDSPLQMTIRTVLPLPRALTKQMVHELSTGAGAGMSTGMSGRIRSMIAESSGSSIETPFKGWLYKRGRDVARKWKRRYFYMMPNNQLFYYDKVPSLFYAFHHFSFALTEQDLKKKHGTIDMRLVTVVRVSPKVCACACACVR